ncbi:hypothetical protein PENTCL1PPCAC_10699 [Pristionchus entomophagus]|uniref:Secreted protein n=1 Tax=Pristionchus entomophagus TaxID=358040 RepID=A0AAV5T7I6_9BILA|nr:hypothetical protein PENTCL1PPCAC_10699 [Pristionchus entomophagus]
MRTLLLLLAILLVCLAVHVGAQHEKRESKLSPETATHRAFTTPMRRRPQFHKRIPPPSTRKPVATNRAVVARRGPAPPATPSHPVTEGPINRAAPGIVPPKGIASQLNQAKFHEFMSLARSLMKSRRVLA